MTSLIHRDDDALARCSHCGLLAVGPCARCHAPTCGNCCVLTEGGTTVYAICLTCDRRGGRRLTAAWLLVLWWLGLPIGALALVLILIACFGP